MKPIRVMHFSDLHVDHVLSHYRREVRARRRQELHAAFRYLVDQAIGLEVHILISAGDLLCSSSVADTTVEMIQAGFRRLEKAGIFVACVPGEDEEADGLELLRRACRGSNVHLFSGEEWTRINPISGVSLWGLRTTGRNAGTSVLGNLKIDNPGINVGIMHASTEDQQSSGAGLATVVSSHLAASGLDYLALGHYHNVLNCSAGAATCWYSGSPVHHDFSTRGERHALLVTFESGRAIVDKILVPSRQQRVVNMDVTGKSAEHLRNRLVNLANPELCLRLQLEGELAPNIAWLPARMAREFASSFFHLDVVDNTCLAVRPTPQNGPEAILCRKLSGTAKNGLHREALGMALAALGEVNSVDCREDRSLGQKRPPAI